MDYIISIVAIIIAISVQGKVNRLERENRTLRQMIQQLLPQHVVPEPIPEPQPVVSQLQKQAVRVSPPLQPKQKSRSKPERNLENVFGKSVIGVIAAIMMFIGVFAFGTLVFPYLTDGMKVIGMFLISGATLLIGVILHYNRPTVLSTIVTGCGVGMIYISIFVTHLHYQLIGDILTFGCIFIWATGVSWASKRWEMPSLSYLALAGCVISSILAQVYVVQQHMFVEITIYHFMTFLLLIIANKQNHVLFKISAYTSVGLNTILSMIIAVYAADCAQYGWLYLCFVLGLYNLAIGILAYRDKNGILALNSTLALSAHGISTIFTCLIPLFILVDNWWIGNGDGVAVESMAYSSMCMIRSIVFYLCSFAMVLVPYLSQLLTIKDATKRALLLLIAEIILVGVTLFAPIELTSGHRFGFLILFPMCNLLLAHIIQNKTVQNTVYWSGFAFLLLDILTSMIFAMDFGLGGIVYSIVLLMLSCAYMYDKFDNILQFPFFQTAIINTHLIGTLLNVCDDWMVALIIVVLSNIVWSAWVQSDAKPPQISTILTEITESLLASILYILLFAATTEYSVSAYILSLTLIPFVLIRLTSVITSKKAFWCVWYGLKFTIYTFGTLELFTGITEQQFLVSLVFMIIASICIAFGFWKNLKALRIYGLTLVLSSVTKIMILDVWNQDSIIRVIALIVGALICFGISAIYTRIEMKQKYT